MEAIDGGDDGWIVSDGRGGKFSPLVNLTVSDRIAEKGDESCARKGKGVRVTSLSSENRGAGCGFVSDSLDSTRLKELPTEGEMVLSSGVVAARSQGVCRERESGTVGESTARISNSNVGWVGMGLDIGSGMVGLGNNGQCDLDLDLSKSSFLSTAQMGDGPTKSLACQNELMDPLIIIDGNCDPQPAVAIEGLEEGRLAAGDGRRGRLSRRRGRGVRGCLARGMKVNGVMTNSSSRRFLRLARGRGKRIKSVNSMLENQLSSTGISLHVELPNLNYPPGETVTIGGGMVDSGIEVIERVDVVSGEGREQAGLVDVDSQQHSGVAGRLLTIGRRIGVTFRCGEETMIEKLL